MDTKAKTNNSRGGGTTLESKRTVTANNNGGKEIAPTHEDRLLAAAKIAAGKMNPDLQKPMRILEGLTEEDFTIAFTDAEKWTDNGVVDVHKKELYSRLWIKEQKGIKKWVKRYEEDLKKFFDIMHGQLSSGITEKLKVKEDWTAVEGQADTLKLLKYLKEMCYRDNELSTICPPLDVLMKMNKFLTAFQDASKDPTKYVKEMQRRFKKYSDYVGMTEVDKKPIIKAGKQILFLVQIVEGSNQKSHRNLQGTLKDEYCLKKDAYPVNTSEALDMLLRIKTTKNNTQKQPNNNNNNSNNGKGTHLEGNGKQGSERKTYKETTFITNGETTTNEAVQEAHQLLMNGIAEGETFGEELCFVQISNMEVMTETTNSIVGRSIKGKDDSLSHSEESEGSRSGKPRSENPRSGDDDQWNHDSKFDPNLLLLDSQASCNGFPGGCIIACGKLQIDHHFKATKVQLLKFLDKSIAREAVTLYMVAFFNKYTCLEGKRWFFVPFLNPYEKGGEHNFIDEDTPEKHAVLAALSQTRVCRYAISVLLEWGRRKWETCYRNLDDNTTPTHRLKGKQPNNTMEFDKSTIVEDLVLLFDELKELGLPQSTRIMRVETGVGLRDREEGVVELPPSFSKRSIYYEFCHDWGWTVKLKKNLNSVLEVTPVEPFEGDRELICSWPYFLKYWDTNFPNIKIVSRSTDVCSNLKRYFLNNKKKVDVKEVLVERKTRKVFEQNDEYAPLVMEPEAALSENDKILMDANLHVKQAADRRRVCSMKIKEAHHDYLHTVQHSERRYCLVVDYCQNAQLPNLGATQPGDTYYMTSLTIAILGIVDYSLEGGSLDAFAYHEGIENEVGGELTVLMDNCGGHNKNNHVLRLANLLVEAGYFKKVNFMDYQNINTFEQLCKALGMNERITIHSVKDGDFKHYKRLEDLFYKDLKTGTIQPGRIFTVASDAPTTIKIWQDCLGTADVSVQDLQKRVTMDHDHQFQEAAQDFVLLDPVAPTGIKEIKQIELYTKWRKLVPAEFVEIICPYPGDEVMQKFKEERNRKARKRTQQKEDTSSTMIGSTVIHCNAGSVATTMEGDLPGYVMVWYLEGGIANILSLDLVSDKYQVTLDTKDGTTRMFNRADNNLYICNLNEQNEAIFVITTEEGKKEFIIIIIDIKRAKKAQQLQEILDFPSTKELLYMIDNNRIQDCSTTRKVVLMAEDILFGVNTNIVKGKAVRQQPNHIRDDLVPVPPEVLTWYRDITLAIDIYTVNGIKFFEPYHITSDFEPAKPSMTLAKYTIELSQGCHWNLPPDEGFLYNWTSKERCQCTFAAVPFDKMPPRMVIELVNGVDFWLNSSTMTSGLNTTLSTQEIITREKLKNAN
eukprot:jgi/Psemu1/20491/gm1.20491_g